MITLNNAFKRTLVVIVCFTFFTVIVHGQHSLSRPPKHAVKFSPLHLVNPDLASVQLAYEYRFAERFSAQVEVGYVFGDVRWTYPSEEARGIKLKEELRWYINHKTLTKRSGTFARSMYLSMEFHQNRMEFIKDDYRPYLQTGEGIKFGFVRYSSWGFIFDCNLGLSFARTNMEPVSIPLNGYEEGLSGYRIVLPIIGFRLGYWLE